MEHTVAYDNLATEATDWSWDEPPPLYEEDKPWIQT